MINNSIFMEDKNIHKIRTDINLTRIYEDKYKILQF